MEFSADKIMEAIRPILADPMAGKGHISLGELVHDRLVALEQSNTGGAITAMKPTPPKERKRRRTKEEMQAAREAEQNGGGQ